MLKLLTKLYVRDIERNIKSTGFSINMLINTTSKSVSNVLELLFQSDKLNLISDAEYEFSLHIDESGEKYILYDKAGVKADENTVLGIIIHLLKHYFNINKVLLPASVSEKIEDIAINSGLSVLYSSISKDEQLSQMAENELYIQERLTCDGIFFAVSLLDYLNYNKLTFKSITGYFPEVYISSEKVKSVTSSTAELLDAVSDKFNGNRLKLSRGVKVYGSNGWILIIPEEHQGTITVITESTSLEAAEELCDYAVKKIKTCKN